MLLIGTRFSPAGPMEATSNSGPFSFASVALLSKVPFPHRWEASSMVTFSSSILMYTGLSLCPSTIIASYPAYLKAWAICPPMWASTMEYPLLQQESSVMFMRPEQGTPEAVSGPTPKTHFASGPSGSVSSGTSSQITLYPRPMPPM